MVRKYTKKNNQKLNRRSKKNKKGKKRTMKGGREQQGTRGSFTSGSLGRKSGPITAASLAGKIGKSATAENIRPGTRQRANKTFKKYRNRFEQRRRLAGQPIRNNSGIKTRLTTVQGKIHAEKLKLENSVEKIIEQILLKNPNISELELIKKISEQQKMSIIKAQQLMKTPGMMDRVVGKNPKLNGQMSFGKFKGKVNVGSKGASGSIKTPFGSVSGKVGRKVGRKGVQVKGKGKGTFKGKF